VIPHFLRRTVRGGTLVIHGKGEQTRDFVFITDVIEALVSAATSPTIDRAVINIGSGVETSIRDLAQLVLEAVGTSAEWLYKEDQDPGSSRMCADIRQARAKLGYRPQVSLREGLARTIAKDPRLQPVPVE
jgi:UDP-glucose 4-epimerase